MGPINLAQFMAAQNGTRLPEPAIEQVMAAINALPSEQPQPGQDHPVGTFNDFVEEPFQVPAVPINQSESQVTKESVGTKQSGGVSVGAGQSGFSPQKFAQVQQAGNATDRAIAAGNQRVESQYADERARMDQAADMEVQAEQAGLAVQQEKITADAENKRFLADIEANYRLKEQAAYKQAQANSEANFAQYKASQDEWAAMSVRPNALFEDAGPLNQFGMGMAAFVHDFLGAKGIKTSAMDTLNSAIRRNVDAQLANMTHKGNVTQGFKQLWEMQRAMSATDAEARARLHGFALRDAELKGLAILGQYDSKLAATKSMAYVAGIRKEQAKNDLAVQKYIQDAQHQNASLLIQREGHQLSAAASKANAYMHYKASKERLDFDKQQANKPKQIDPSELGAPIYDQSVSGKGKILGRFKPEFKKDETLVRNITAKHLKAQEAIRLIKEIEEIQQQTGVTKWELLPKKAQSELTRRAEALREAMINSMLYDMSGKAVTQQEYERLSNQIPSKDIFTNGTNRKIIYQKMDQIIKESDQIVQQYLDPTVQGDPRHGTSVNVPKFAEAEGIEADQLKRKGQEDFNPAESQDPSIKTDYIIHKRGGDNPFKGISNSPYQTPYEQFTSSSLNSTKAGGDVDEAFTNIYALAKAAGFGDKKAQTMVSNLADNIPDPDLTAKENELIKNYALFSIASTPALKKVIPEAFREVQTGVNKDRAEGEALMQQAGKRFSEGGLPGANYSYDTEEYQPGEPLRK